MPLLNDGSILDDFAAAEAFFFGRHVSPVIATRSLGYLIGDNAYFNRITIKRISMRFFSPYAVFQTRRFR
ncbi:hypothetical protein [Caballeronia sp. dw_19]|uniref:hypothetical protein n=1 Tax=Caballeronia sp. dw_19 TaxID=2719791 RepID=UPI001BD48AC6|nr:hypothetical protein [Caballeronia sp. dw_19]